MRVLVDASAAAHGGLGTYVHNLISAWSAHYPEDDLVVLGSRQGAVGQTNCTLVPVDPQSPASLTRPVIQTVATQRALRAFRPNVVLATMPSLSWLTPKTPVSVVVHDLRHELRPEQFSAGRRALRAIAYSRAYQQASSFICVSERTRSDLGTLHPHLHPKPMYVVHHGGDHVLSWPSASGLGRPRAVAFSHHTNKNARMVIDAWSLANNNQSDLPDLLILGASGTERSALNYRVAQAGLADRIEVAEYLDESSFRTAFSGARVIIFPSSFEGFGLPVIEAMSLGIPVVISPDRALREVSGHHGFVMQEWSPQAIVHSTVEALTAPTNRLSAARLHGLSFTWSLTAKQTRAALMDTAQRVATSGSAT